MSKVVLITGASRGIGAATARLAAARGYAVGINYTRDAAAAEAVARAVRDAGANAVTVRADVADEAQVVAMFDTVAGALGGPIDALVNNAGILFKQSRLEDLDAARINRVLAVNVTGTIICAREAVRRMSTSRGGSGGAIVNVSSAASRLGGPNEYIDYAASKGAVDSLTIGLAKEVATQGIRVNAVRPGIIATDIHASGGEPGRVARVAPNVPMQRGGEPEEVASAVVWLLGDEASYVTGAILDITGGR
jgi:NAD(P)-dependent dehydrogenase (short-subunit alcohol dehydrogenase family)